VWFKCRFSNSFSVRDPNKPRRRQDGIERRREGGRAYQTCERVQRRWLLVSSPPASEPLVEYYDAVTHEAGALPTLGYHFPRVSSPGNEVSGFSALTIQGVKNSSDDFERLPLTKRRGSGVSTPARPLSCHLRGPSDVRARF